MDELQNLHLLDSYPEPQLQPTSHIQHYLATVRWMVARRSRGPVVGRGCCIPQGAAGSAPTDGALANTCTRFSPDGSGASGPFDCRPPDDAWCNGRRPWNTLNGMAQELSAKPEG